MSESNNHEMDKNGLHTTNGKDNNTPENGGLIQFVMQEAERQKMQPIDVEDTAADEDMSEIDHNREQNFFCSALSAINKMNAEVERSKRKQEKLHAKYGAGRYSEWQTQHAAEVLQPQESSSITRSNDVANSST